MLRLIAGILIVLWLIGLLAHIAGAFIHVVLLIAVVVLAYDLLKGRKTA